MEYWWKLSLSQINFTFEFALHAFICTWCIKIGLVVGLQWTSGYNAPLDMCAWSPLHTASIHQRPAYVRMVAIKASIHFITQNWMKLKHCCLGMFATHHQFFQSHTRLPRIHTCSSEPMDLLDKQRYLMLHIHLDLQEMERMLGENTILTRLW